MNADVVASGDGADLATQRETGSAAFTGFDFTNTWRSNPDVPPKPKLQPRES